MGSKIWIRADDDVTTLASIDIDTKELTRYGSNEATEAKKKELNKYLSTAALNCEELQMVGLMKAKLNRLSVRWVPKFIIDSDPDAVKNIYNLDGEKIELHCTSIDELTRSIKFINAAGCSYTFSDKYNGIYTSKTRIQEILDDHNASLASQSVQEEHEQQTEIEPESEPEVTQHTVTDFESEEQNQDFTEINDSDLDDYINDTTNEIQESYTSPSLDYDDTDEYIDLEAEAPESIPETPTPVIPSIPVETKVQPETSTTFDLESSLYDDSEDSYSEFEAALEKINKSEKVENPIQSEVPAKTDESVYRQILPILQQHDSISVPREVYDSLFIRQRKILNMNSDASKITSISEIRLNSGDSNRITAIVEFDNAAEYIRIIVLNTYDNLEMSITDLNSLEVRYNNSKKNHSYIIR